MTNMSNHSTTRRPSSQVPSITINYSRMIARQLSLQERELWRLLKGTGINYESFLDDNLLLSKQEQLLIMANAMEISGKPEYGLQLGKALTLPMHGPFGFLASSAPNLGTAIQDAQNFLPSRVSFTRLVVEQSGENQICHYKIDAPAGTSNALYRCAMECLVLSLNSLIEFVLGRPLTEGRIYLEYPTPTYHEKYRDHLHCPITFGATESKLVFPADLMLTANTSPDPRCYEFAYRQCQQQLEQFEATTNKITDRVRKLFLSYPPGQLSEVTAAKLSYVSRRTLVRRLEAESTSFRELKENHLANLATDYLKDTEFSVEVIATMLNYHDGSSFRRAFKRWHNVTPEDYRQRNKRGENN